MLWTQIKLLLPSFAGYWIFLICLASLTWYVWTRVYTHWVFRWQGPFLVATVFSFSVWGHTLLNMYQNGVLATFQQNVQAAAQQANQKPVDVALQMKDQFLKNVEYLIQNPDQITPENKKKLFDGFAQLFPKGRTDREMAAGQIEGVYKCQRYFWEDALATYKAKKVVKSDATEECGTLSGTFFNRPKLVSQDAVKANDETLANLAKHKRLPTSDGKDVEVTEKMLRDAVENQIKAAQAARRIFE